MKLELKHLAHYLPYELRLIWNNEEKLRTVEMSPTNIQHTCEYVNSTTSKTGNEDMWKPILRPLSDLTKEIEINGEKINPKSELYQLLGGGYSSIEAFENDSWVFSMSIANKDQIENTVDKAPYEIIKRLFEWHFDVFGLIEKELAININTL